MNPQGPPAFVAPAVSPSPVSTVQLAQKYRMNRLLTNAYVLLDGFGLQTLWILKADCIRRSSQLFAFSCISDRTHASKGESQKVLL
jgi:hypothetical protein